MRAKEGPAARRMGDGASWGVVALPGASPYEGRAARTAALSAFATRPSRGSIISGGWCARRAFSLSAPRLYHADGLQYTPVED